MFGQIQPNVCADLFIDGNGLGANQSGWYPVRECIIYWGGGGHVFLFTAVVRFLVGV